MGNENVVSKDMRANPTGRPNDKESAGSEKDRPIYLASKRMDEANPGSSYPGLADLCEKPA